MSRYTVLMPDDIGIKSLSTLQLQALAADAEIAVSGLLEDTTRRALLTVRALFDGRQFHIDREQVLELHEILYGIQDLSFMRTDYVAYECALYFWNDSTPPLAIATAVPQSTTETTLTVVFTDASTGTITRWLWDFGDGSDPVFANSTILSHFYAAPGIYFPSLTVSNPLGQTSNINFTVKVGVDSLLLVTEDGKQVVTETDIPIAPDV